jgi:hypothetical protein
MMKTVSFLVTGVTFLALLSGCGSDSKVDSPPATAGGGSTTTDSFMTTVRTTVANAPDDIDSTNIDSVQATEPEGNEPEVVE